MTNDARNPAHPAPVPDDDPEAQRLLAEVGRFSPRQGFEDRVVKQVRVPIPRWLRGIRDRIQAVTSGVPGSIMLATFSLATTRKWRDKEGNDKEDTQWHNIKEWGRTAEVATRIRSRASCSSGIRSRPAYR